MCNDYASACQLTTLQVTFPRQSDLVFSPLSKTFIIMSRTLKVTGYHVMISKGNHVKFTHFVLLVISEEAKTCLPFFSFNVIACSVACSKELEFIIVRNCEIASTMRGGKNRSCDSCFTRNNFIMSWRAKLVINHRKHKHQDKASRKRIEGSNDSGTQIISYETVYRFI